jgi:hypothetical protein
MVNTVNGPLVVAGQGPLATVVQGLRSFTTQATLNIRQQDGTVVPAGPESNAILSAYQNVMLPRQSTLPSASRIS